MSESALSRLNVLGREQRPRHILENSLSVRLADKILKLSDN